jgi:hypothetical protein
VIKAGAGVVLAAALLASAGGTRADAEEYAGLTGRVGAPANAKRVKTLRITEPGVYENILVDGEWIQQDLVRILADDVVLRNVTVRYGQRDGIEVYARKVRIENCHIHHLLNQTFKEQKDNGSYQMLYVFATLHVFSRRAWGSFTNMWVAWGSSRGSSTAH